MHTKQKLFIIDDNHDDVLYISNLFRNYEIINSRNFLNLDDLTVSVNPDLIVINFETLNHYGPASESLHAKLISINVPILFILDKMADRTAISNLTPLSYDYVVKPFDEDDLLLKVRNLLKLNHLAKREKLLIQKLSECIKMTNIITISSKVSHDIRNMLGPIMCYSEMLIRNCLTSTRIDGYVQKIKESVERLKQDTQSLQDCLSSVRSSPEPVSINELLGELFSVYGQNGEACPQIRLNVPEDVPEVKIDRNQILYALANLLVNLNGTCLFNKEIDISAYSTDEVAINKDGKAIGFLEKGYAVISITYTIKDENIYNLIEMIESAQPPYSEPEKLAFRTADIIVRRNEGFLKIRNNNDKIEFNIYLPTAN